MQHLTHNWHSMCPLLTSLIKLLSCQWSSPVVSQIFQAIIMQCNAILIFWAKPPWVTRLASVVTLWVEDWCCVLTGTIEDDQLNKLTNNYLFEKFFFSSFYCKLAEISAVGGYQTVVWYVPVPKNIKTQTFTIKVEKLPDCWLLRGKEQCGHVIVLSILTEVRLGVVPLGAAL